MKQSNTSCCNKCDSTGTGAFVCKFILQYPPPYCSCHEKWFCVTCKEEVIANSEHKCHLPKEK